MEPLHVEEKLTEKTLHQRSPYHDAYEEQAYTKPEWWFPTSHEMKDESYGYAYNKYQYTEPLHIEENSTETMLHQRLTYYDFDEEQGYPKPERWFSSYDATKDQSCSYDYNKYNNYMEPLHIEENFMDPMLHQRLTYHDTEEHTYPKQSSYSEFGENNFHVDHQYSCERPTNEQPLSFELEPYKPTWSQNLNHQEYYGGELSLQSFVSINPYMHVFAYNFLISFGLDFRLIQSFLFGLSGRCFHALLFCRVFWHFCALKVLDGYLSVCHICYIY
ncbi:uncharacterized protein LOC109828492 [Asparagus officinalis]|uniref:uncharacterized protein LOC109828492 n=1 Tax=Asparagus officinalis TaxID=4686 RepID=UPI00098DF226|nr:uncharacterized protein LOC109828492 [Asparagus officinalis]